MIFFQFFQMLPRTLGLIKKPTMYIRLLILEMQFFIFGDKMNNDFTVSNLVFSNVSNGLKI